MANNNLTHIEVCGGGVWAEEGECRTEGYILFIIYRKHSSALHSQPFKAGSFCLPARCKLNEPNAADFLVHSQSLASACWLIRELRRRRRQMGQKLLFMLMWWISRVNNQRHALIKCLSLLLSRPLPASFPPSVCVCVFELHIYLRVHFTYEQSEVATCTRYQLQCPIQWVSGALNRLLFDRSSIGNSFVDLLKFTELWRPFKLGALNKQLIIHYPTYIIYYII